MIPKVIHKIWLSNEEMDKHSKMCVESWKRVLPDYQIRGWSLKDFDIENMPFVKKAISLKKWAFATDYLRMYVVNKEGGIYLDTDVYITKKLDNLLDNDFFSFVECHKKAFNEHKNDIDSEGNLVNGDYIPGLCIQAATFGAIKDHPYTKAVLEYYNSLTLETDDSLMPKGMIAPDIYAKVATNFGFKYIDKTQYLNNGITIYNSNNLSGSIKEYKKSAYGIHLCLGSWRKKNIVKNIYNKFRLMVFIHYING